MSRTTVLEKNTCGVKNEVPGSFPFYARDIFSFSLAHDHKWFVVNYLLSDISILSSTLETFKSGSCSMRMHAQPRWESPRVPGSFSAWEF